MIWQQYNHPQIHFKRCKYLFRLSTESHSITEGFIQRIPQEMVSVTG